MTKLDAQSMRLEHKTPGADIPYSVSPSFQRRVLTNSRVIHTRAEPNKCYERGHARIGRVTARAPYAGGKTR